MLSWTLRTVPKESCNQHASFTVEGETQRWLIAPHSHTLSGRDKDQNWVPGNQVGTRLLTLTPFSYASGNVTFISCGDSQRQEPSESQAAKHMSLPSVRLLSLMQYPWRAEKASPTLPRFSQVFSISLTEWTLPLEVEKLQPNTIRHLRPSQPHANHWSPSIRRSHVKLVLPDQTTVLERETKSYGVPRKRDKAPRAPTFTFLAPPLLQRLSSSPPSPHSCGWLFLTSKSSLLSHFQVIW